MTVVSASGGPSPARIMSPASYEGPAPSALKPTKMCHAGDSPVGDVSTKDVAEHVLMVRATLRWWRRVELGAVGFRRPMIVSCVRTGGSPTPSRRAPTAAAAGSIHPRQANRKIRATTSPGTAWGSGAVDEPVQVAVVVIRPASISCTSWRVLPGPRRCRVTGRTQRRSSRQSARSRRHARSRAARSRSGRSAVR